MRGRKGLQKKNVDRIIHCWFKVTDRCLNKAIQIRAKCRAKKDKNVEVTVLREIWRDDGMFLHEN